MDKYLSAKYYQDNKERLKKTCEQYKSLSTEEKGTIQKSIRRCKTKADLV